MTRRRTAGRRVHCREGAARRAPHLQGRTRPASLQSTISEEAGGFGTTIESLSTPALIASGDSADAADRP